MFPHRIGKGYDNPSYKVVKEINGIRVKNIRHLVELLRDSKEKYTTIGFDDRASETIVFNHKEALNATEEVLSDNGIREQASDDLAGGLGGEEEIVMQFSVFSFQCSVKTVHCPAHPPFTALPNI